MSQPKIVNLDQQSFLNPSLLDQLNPKHSLLQLVRKIEQLFFEDVFTAIYSYRGKPLKSIHLMAEFSTLEHLENLSDENLTHHWVQSPYYWAFTGAIEFQWQPFFDLFDLGCFRKCIGSNELEKILVVSIVLHKEKVCEDSAMYLVA